MSNIDRYKELARKIVGDKAVRDKLIQQHEDGVKEVDDLTKYKEDCEKAQVVVQNVAKITQQQIKYELSELATLAMETVFPNPQKIDIEFDLKRGKTECVISFVDPVTGDKINPIRESSGGSIDVAALALQISLWSLQQDRSRNTFILDEPLKFLKGQDLPEKGAQLIKEISERLGVQIIMVSHSPELIDSADRVFEVTQNRKGVSRVTYLEGEL